MAPASHLVGPTSAGGDLASDLFRVERFEFVTAELLLRLSVRVAFDLPGRARPTLFVERELGECSYPPLLSPTGRKMSAGESLWRWAFAVPAALACDPFAKFALRLGDDVLLALPAPSGALLLAEQPSPRNGSPRTLRYVLRRGVLLFVVTGQLCLMPAWSTGALADGYDEAPPAPPVGANTAPASTQTALQTATPAAAVTPAPAARKAPSVAAEHGQETTATNIAPSGPSTPNARHSTPDTKASRGSSTSANDIVALSNVAPPPQVTAAEARMLAAELASSTASSEALAFYRIPPFLLPIYRAAAAQYGVPWQILAAINEIETDYGSDLSVSSAGAVGWMQFMPTTWIQYGVDAVNAGYADPYNPVDAIFAAARYLRAAGAPTDLRAAILAYNHSAEYVSSVLLRAKLISAYPRDAISTLTGLFDGRPPVTGRQLAWEVLPAASPSNAAAHAMTRKRGTVARDSTAPAPTVAGAAVTGARARNPQRADLLSARNAAVVAVQAGRIVQLGSSRGSAPYVVLRDIYGDLFSYTGLGRIARVYTLPTAAAGSADRRSSRTGHTLAMRVGSLVAQGTVLGHVRVPYGARDGHLVFEIRPAGDPDTVDPGPILANWTQLNAALHPQGAEAESNLLGAPAPAGLSPGRGAHSAGTGRTAPLPLAMSGLTAEQWTQLITRIAALPIPKIATKPSAAAIPDSQASPEE